MMVAELFEVKNGDNKGVYLKVSNIIPKETQMDLIAKKLQAGYINSNNINFYRRHGAANNRTLQSLDTFEQIATIWRLNAYGIGNQQTMDYKIHKINEVIDLLNKQYIQEMFKSA